MRDFVGEFHRETIIERIMANRDSHKAAFNKAFEGYRKVMIKELEERMAKIHEGRPIDPYLRYQAPEDHTSDYDDVIDMLSMGLGDTVELDQSQFRCYVRDDWGWKQQWTTSNAEYVH